MDKLPKKINSIARKSSIVLSDGIRYIWYEINENEQDRTEIPVQLPEYSRPKKSNEIVDSNDSFVNGFAVVKTANGEYAYIRESDNLLMPFRYDIASDFNEFGFAIVGKDGSVSWINKDFKYLNLSGVLVDEELDKSWSKFNGWQDVSAFNDYDTPLSRVYDGRNMTGRVVFFGTDGKLKAFYKYDGEHISKLPKYNFTRSTRFDEKGHAVADEKILFAEGYYISYNDLIKMCMESRFIDNIGMKAQICLDREKEKVLKKGIKQ